MQEDGASPAFDPRSLVVPEIDDDIVEVIVPPDGFVPCRVGEANMAIVTPVADIVAPAVVGLRPSQGEKRSRLYQAVGAIKPFTEGKQADRSSEIALPFGAGDSVSSNGTRKPQPSCDKDPLLVVQGRSIDADDIQGGFLHVDRSIEKGERHGKALPLRHSSAMLSSVDERSG